MSKDIKIQVSSEKHSATVFKNTEDLVGDLMKQYYQATFVKDKLEIAREINRAYNTSISAAQVAINALRASIEEEESRLKQKQPVVIVNKY